VEAVKKAPSWVPRVLLPEIGEMKGDIRALNITVAEMDKRHMTSIDALRTEFRPEFKVMHAKA
jgi:hypothetical protein